MAVLTQTSATKVGWNGLEFDCLTGARGFTRDKTEGDKKTPVGRFKTLRAYYREDVYAKPQSLLPVTAITPDMGWSDDPADPLYNLPVTLPRGFSHEKLYRDDRSYDLLIVTSYNTEPIIPGKGSAIFIHLANGNAPTAGCLALKYEDLSLIIATATPDSEWIVGENLA